MKIKIWKVPLFFVFASFAFYGCFSAWKGDEATLTLLLGNSQGGRVIAPDVSGIVHTIDLIGPTGRQSHTIEGDKQISITVMPGYWEISVLGVFKKDGTPCAEGYGSADIKAGRDNPVEIKMIPIVSEQGSGTLEFTLQYNGSFNFETFTLNPISSEAPEINVLEDIGVGVEVGKQYTIYVSAGYYMLSMKLEKTGPAESSYASKSEEVHIYNGLTTAIEYTFTDGDFE